MFVTFEGVDGAGKSTLISALAEHLRSQGHRVCQTREPGAGAFGASIRELLLESEIGAEAELFLFLADRSEHVRTTIREALSKGEIVLCDRFCDSTVVYQGYGRGFDLEMLKQLNKLATNGLVPTRTYLLDVDPSVAALRGTKGDRLDREAEEFHQKVRAGFLAMAHQEPSRFVVLNAELSREDLLREALAAWPK